MAAGVFLEESFARPVTQGPVRAAVSDDLGYGLGYLGVHQVELIKDMAPWLCS